MLHSTLTAQLQRSCPQCNLHVARAYNVHSLKPKQLRVVSVVPGYSIAKGSSTPTLSTQQASLNLCAKSRPGFSTRFLVAVEDFFDMRRVQCSVRYQCACALRE